MKTTQYAFIIPGRAFSARSRAARQYKARIAGIAAQNINKPLTYPDLHVKVDYFYKTKNRVDGDNLLKPILDGLKGVAYLDDAQVTHPDPYLHNIDSTYSIDEPISPDIFDLLSEGQEFVAVLVRKRPRLVLKTSFGRK